MRDKLTILSGTAHWRLAQDIAQQLDVVPGRTSVGRFPDGEIDVKLQTDIRGADVFIVQPTSPPVNENLMELLLLIDSAKRASADRVTAVLPYYGYARKDRKDEGRVPITAKLVANLITVAGADRVLALDLHAAQIQGFFDIPVDHLYAKPVLVEYFRQLALERATVVAPDMGGMKRARAYAADLGTPLAIVDKRRVSGDEVAWENLVGEVRDTDCLVVDDMIATGGSIVQAARILRKFGARRIFIVATHGVLCGRAVERLEECSEIEQVVITDSICQPERPGSKIIERSIAALLARAIDRIHRSESVSALFEENQYQ
ncbi:MAG: ribose-phosphate pyrophosphokinase [Planctomycetota bacterium]